MQYQPIVIHMAFWMIYHYRYFQTFILTINMTTSNPLHCFQLRFTNKTTSIHSEARAIKNEIPLARKSHWAGPHMTKLRPH